MTPEPTLQASSLVARLTDHSPTSADNDRARASTQIAPSAVRHSRTIEAIYDRYASFYDWLFGPVLDPGRRMLAARASELAPSQILEIGVGTGLTIPHYHPSLKILGVDISSQMLAKAQALTYAKKGSDFNGPSVDLVRMNAEHLAFADASFDCVCMPYVVSTVSCPDRLLRETIRVTRPGGTILVLNHFAGSAVWRTGEKLVSPLRNVVGFQTSLEMNAVLSHPLLEIHKVTSVNLLGLSKLVELVRK